MEEETKELTEPNGQAESDNLEGFWLTVTASLRSMSGYTDARDMQPSLKGRKEMWAEFEKYIFEAIDSGLIKAGDVATYLKEMVRDFKKDWFLKIQVEMLNSKLKPSAPDPGEELEEISGETEGFVREVVPEETEE